MRVGVLCVYGVGAQRDVDQNFAEKPPVGGETAMIRGLPEVRWVALQRRSAGGMDAMGPAVAHGLHCWVHCVQHVASRRRELEARLWEIDAEVRS